MDGSPFPLQRTCSTLNIKNTEETAKIQERELARYLILSTQKKDFTNGMELYIASLIHKAQQVANVKTKRRVAKKQMYGTPLAVSPSPDTDTIDVITSAGAEEQTVISSHLSSAFLHSQPIADSSSDSESHSDSKSEQKKDENLALDLHSDSQMRALLKAVRNANCDDVLFEMYSANDPLYDVLKQVCEENEVYLTTLSFCLRDVAEQMVIMQRLRLRQPMLYMPPDLETLPMDTLPLDWEQKEEKKEVDQIEKRTVAKTIAKGLSDSLDLSPETVEWLKGFELKKSSTGTMDSGTCQGCFHSIKPKRDKQRRTYEVRSVPVVAAANGEKKSPEDADKAMGDRRPPTRFVFHDALCVELRKYKECIRQMVFCNEVKDSPLDSEKLGELMQSTDTQQIAVAYLKAKKLLPQIDRTDGYLEQKKIARPNLPDNSNPTAAHEVAKRLNKYCLQFKNEVFGRGDDEYEEKDEVVASDGKALNRNVLDISDAAASMLSADKNTRTELLAQLKAAKEKKETLRGAENLEEYQKAKDDLQRIKMQFTEQLIEEKMDNPALDRNRFSRERKLAALHVLLEHGQTAKTDLERRAVIDAASPRRLAFAMGFAEKGAATDGGHAHSRAEAQRMDWLHQIRISMPSMIRYCDVLTFGPSLWQFCVKLLQQKDRAVVWKLLFYFASVMPTSLVIQLMRETRDALVVSSLRNVERLFRATVQTSVFPAATALFLAALMKTHAEQESGREKDLMKLSQKYVNVATDLLSDIESDHLLALLCEIPSEMEGMSLLEIAMDYEMTSFLNWHRFGPLFLQMWYRVDYLNPEPFPQLEWSARRKVLLLTQTPVHFYYSGFGQFVISSLLYVLYLALFSLVTTELDSYLYSDLRKEEIALWICNVGFIGFEVVQIYIDGFAEYIKMITNKFDVVISGIWVALCVLRGGAYLTHNEDDMDSKRKEDFRNRPSNIVYTVLWAIQLLLMWFRLALIARRSIESFASLVKMVGKMVLNVMSFLALLLTFSLGFIFALFYVIGPDMKKDCVGADSIALFGFHDIALYVYQSLLGQQEWDVVMTDSRNECMSSGRIFVAQIIVVVYCLFGSILLLNLLIALMASTYNDVKQRAVLESNFATISATYEYSRAFVLIASPFDLLATAVGCCLASIDNIIILLSVGYHSFNAHCITPLRFSYDKQYETKRNRSVTTENTDALSDAHNADTDEGCCGTGLHCCSGFRGRLSKIVVGWSLKEHAKACRFCRSKIGCANGQKNIQRYFDLLEKHRPVDESDKELVRRVLGAHDICDYCFRPLKSGDRLHGWQINYEAHSFLVFMCFVWLPLCIVFFLPGVVAKLISELFTVARVEKNTDSADAMTRKSTLAPDSAHLKYRRKVASALLKQDSVACLSDSHSGVEDSGSSDRIAQLLQRQQRLEEVIHGLLQRLDATAVGSAQSEESQQHLFTSLTIKSETVSTVDFPDSTDI